MPFPNVTVIGLGLIGSSLARAVQLHIPGVRDADTKVRETAPRIKLCDHIAESASGTALERAIRLGERRRAVELFSCTRSVRRSIIDKGQDDARPDFGRSHE